MLMVDCGDGIGLRLYEPLQEAAERYGMAVGKILRIMFPEVEKVRVFSCVLA